MFFKVNDKSQIQICVKLAREIWTEHYSPIIGSEQVSYMLEKYQSVRSITQQINDGLKYYLVEENKGYFAYSIQQECLFISKLYVYEKYRQQGIGRQILDFITSRTADQSLLRLTVNRNNRGAIEFYRKNGFKNAEQKNIDIGNGFFMNDYVMEKEIT